MVLKRFDLVFAALLIIALIAIAVPVSADTITVNNPVTSEQFQNLLNGAASGSTIIFEPGIYWMHDILITKDVMLESDPSDGGNEQNTIIDGINASDATTIGIFYNNSVYSEGTTITIENLTLQNGYTAQSTGGGAVCSYGNISVISSDFINDTTDLLRPGGALSGASGTGNITVSGSNFINCSGQRGGAIFDPVGFVFVNSSSFVNGYGSDGGAIYGNDGVIATFCRFSNINSGNHAIITTNGGTIYAPNNWWGTNNPDPSIFDLNGGTLLTYYPWLNLTVTSTPVTTMGQTSSIQANVSYYSDGTPQFDNIPTDGMPVSFTVSPATSGTMNPPSGTFTNMFSPNATFTPLSGGPVTVNVNVDNTIIPINFEIVPTLTGITPGNGVNNIQIPITITGSGFYNTSTILPTINLTQTGYSNITLTNVNVSTVTSIDATVPAEIPPGLWNVVVTNPDGQECTNTLIFYTALSPAPTVTGITPSSGVNTTSIAIMNLTGTNFVSGATVQLNRTGYSSITATNVNVVSSTKITCTLPITGVPAGQWNFVVTNPDTQQGMLTAGFTVMAPAPTVTGITPGSGVNTTSIAITNLAGTNFVFGATVELNLTGNSPVVATSVNVVSSTEITCTLPITGIPAGQWNVVVTNPDTQQGMLTAGFTVMAPAPTVTGITPASGVNTTSIAITNLAGANFAKGANVQLNRTGYSSITATSVSVVSSTNITCTLPAGVPSGFWNVVVTNPDGQQAILPNGFRVMPPQLIAVFTNSTTTPRSGVEPLSVTFTDLSTGGPTGWAWFFGDEPYNQSWTEQTASAGWSQRMGSSSVVMPDSSIILIGGKTNSQYFSDVWKSADNGMTWTNQTGSVPYGARAFFTSNVMPDGSIVLMGGMNAGNDVWRSTDEGATWTEQTVHAGWSGRYGASSVVMPDGSIILMGGSNGNNLNDVWRSTDEGATWTEQTAHAGWSGRLYFTSVVMPDGSIIVMAGLNSGTGLNDVWRSTDEGVTWTEQIANAPWVGRYGLNSVVEPDASIVMMAGNPNTPGLSNDVWRSTDEGVTWTELTANATWSGRAHATAVAVPDGSIVLMSGALGGTSFSNGVWRLQPVGSSLQNPSHIYTTPGTYPVALQVLNSITFNSTRKISYVTVAMQAPVAGFTENITNGIAPLSIQFTDTSTHSPTSWYWVFGDGNTSTQQNPVFAYSIPGTYSVNLTAFNAGGNSTSVAQTIRVIEPKPVAQFTEDTTSGTAPLSVQFNDTSTNSPTSWYWVFGDGNTSTQQNPVFTYSIPGTYSVNLTAFNGGGNSTSVAQTITVIEPKPVTSFIENTTSGIAPLAVKFTDTSTNSPTSWFWVFGDGNTSTQQNPVFTYSIPGTYSVNLTAFNGGGNSTSVAQTITVIEPKPVAQFMENTTSGTAPLAVQYTDTSTNSPISWYWVFGDGNTSMQQNPVFTYSIPGTYSVNLTAFNAGGNSTSVAQTITVIEPKPVAQFTENTTTGVSPLSVQFTDTSTNSPMSWYWVFGDGNTSTQQSPVFTYGIPGIYSVNLTAFNAGGNSTSVAQTITVIEPKPVAQFMENTTSGTAPLAVKFTDTSTNSPTSWYWVFGDGNTSTQQNPVFTYSIPGTYSVNLTAFNGGGNSTSVAQTITVIEPKPVAQFTENTTTGVSPLSVQFTDTSTNSPMSWYWVFGDGNTSTQQSPVFTYGIPGIYSVNLTAFNAGGNSTSVAQTITVIEPKPVAQFMENTTSGTAPLAVKFTDTSTNSPTSWYWVFGDGNTSTQQNPVFTYSIPGTYSVNLTAFNGGGNSTSVAQTITVIEPKPVAQFTENTTTGVSPLSVQFTDTSTNSPMSWYWVFGDGNTSTQQSPVFTYGIPGIYSVNLTAFNAGGNSTSVAQTITVIEPKPVAQFMENTTSGTAPLAVKFTDTSTNSPTSWYWVFGDGNTSTQQNPVFTYSIPGTYSVNLTAFNGGGNSTSVAQTITVIEPKPVAQFTENTTTGVSPLSVQFTDTSTNSPMSWYWVFGDGNTSTQQSPVFTYGIPGIYSVNLTAFNAGGNSTSVAQTITVIEPKPVAQFMENTTSGTAPLAVKFTDTSTNSPTSWLWKFGDGTTSTIQNPAYTYTTPGTYTVNVTATNVGGSNLSASQTITVTRSGPTASFIENVTIGTAPLAIQFTDTSTNSPTSWYWVFGDGSTSPVQNATHIFSVPGTYQVNLTAFNAGGESTSSLQMITVTRSGPTASFIENTTTGVSPLTVQFTDTSTNSPTSWYWVFGDGSTSPVQNASHTFATPGTYQVNLTVSNTGGKSTSTLQVITVIPSGTTASFVANPTSGTVPLAVQFNDTSSNSPTSWYWVFGDGNTSIVRNATHTFTTPGTYQVNLTASNAGDKSTSPLQTITVTQSGPTASFVANPTSGTAPLAVQFTDTSTDSPTSWFWVFGDGSTSTVQNVTHTFAVPGTYQVNLTISNAGGKSTSALQAITVTKSVPTPVLTITGIDPTTWTNNVAVPVTITGTGFNTTTKPAVILTQTGYGNITLSGISASSGESLIGIVPAGISPGVWNVVVINPSGQEATNASVQYTATTTTPTQTPTPIVTQHHGSPYNGGGGGNSQTGNTGGTGTGSSKSGVGKSENKYQLAPPESPTSAPITPIQPIPTVSNPTLVTMVLLTLQEYQFWLILGVIIIILIAILRRWWIRRQNPLLFRKFD